MAFHPERLGWRGSFADQVTEDEANAGWQPARVCRVQTRRCHVWCQSGLAALEVKLFGSSGLPAVGDWLLLDPKQKHPPRVLQRFGAVQRRAPGSRLATQIMAANVDTLLIVTACNQEFNQSRLERYLVLAREAGVNAVVVLTKTDLSEDPAGYLSQAQELSTDLRVVSVDARSQIAREQLGDVCTTGQTIAVLGSSGVGKSTLTNNLCGAEQAIGAVRGSDNRGKHTTTSRSLHLHENGCVFVDLPGIREIQLVECTAGINEVFLEITHTISRCRFGNCTHQSEPGCAVTEALASEQIEPRRWKNYQTLCEEQEAYREAKAIQDKRMDRRARS